MMLFLPEHTTEIFVVIRSLACILICFMTVTAFEDKEMMREASVTVKIKYNRTVFTARQCIIGHSMSLGIFVVPFCSKYFTTYIISSVYFAIEMVLINKYFEGDGVSSLIFIPMWWIWMFVATYYDRRTITECFVKQTEAEKTRDALTQVLDNLPDAVLMMEGQRLTYCNQQADVFFGVSLSDLT